MNYDDIVSRVMQGEKIYNLPLRVCYYARVSTGSEVQLNSLDNQLDYYENFIKSNPKWTFINGYNEEGVTGVRADKRTVFLKMINDAKQNKFDLIITKEVSRFARDLEDSIHYIRILKNAGVGVFFENQNLNTFDSNSEMILNIMFNLAQDESRKLSNRVKFGHRQAIEKGRVLGSSNITGYKKDKCKLLIDENEAIFIRTLFELYATGEYGFSKLSKKLSTLGYLNKKGNLYDKDSLKKMITNPKYKGYYRAKTYEVLDYRTKKRKKNSIQEQVLYKCEDGSVPAIVSEELWNKANNVLNARTEGYKNNNYWSGGIKYPLSSKIYCQEHNSNFQRSHGSKKKNRPTWACNMYLQHRLKSCASPIIAEVDLYNILDNIMKQIIPKNKIINGLFKLYNSLNINSEYDKELEKINKNIILIEEKKSMVIDLVISGQIKKSDVKNQFKRLDNDLEKLQVQRQNLYHKIESIKDKNNYLNKLKDMIEKEFDKDLLNDFIRKFVDEIIVSKIDNDRKNIKLEIFINLLGDEKGKIKGARHIDGITEKDFQYLENQVYNSIEKLRSGYNRNKFTYNVYI